MSEPGRNVEDVGVLSPRDLPQENGLLAQWQVTVVFAARARAQICWRPEIRMEAGSEKLSVSNGPKNRSAYGTLLR